MRESNRTKCEARERKTRVRWRGEDGCDERRERKKRRSSRELERKAEKKKEYRGTEAGSKVKVVGSQAGCAAKRRKRKI